MVASFLVARGFVASALRCGVQKVQDKMLAKVQGGPDGNDLVILSDAWPLDPFEHFPVSINIETAKEAFCKIPRAPPPMVPHTIGGWCCVHLAPCSCAG